MSADLYRSFSHLTGARQTMLSWARVIDSPEAIPEIFKTPYQALVKQAGSLPYTVLAPPQSISRTRKPGERLLCEIGDTLYGLERAGAQVITTGYPYAEIRNFEVGNILLYSWFSIHGKTSAGADAAFTVEFNEATLRHFEPFFSKMRPAPTAAYPSDQAAEQAKFDPLSSENFKFMNFARASLVRGERVIQSIYQPPIRLPGLRLAGHTFFRTLSLAHLTILTDQEIILIEDTEGHSENKKSLYGGVRRYLPLRGPVSATLEQRPNAMLSFTLRVSPAVQVERLFPAARLPELAALKQALETFPGRNP